MGNNNNTSGGILALAITGAIALTGTIVHAIDKKQKKKAMKNAHEEGYRQGSNDTKEEIIQKLKKQ